MQIQTIKKTLFLSVLSLGLASQLLATVQDDDKRALLSFYKATGGKNWFNRNHWTSGYPCANAWNGITCEDNRVTGLFLYDNNLKGTIPPEIGNLTNLTVIWLSDGELYGSIPPEIGNLIHLKHLSVESNNLSGSIPSEIGNLTDLLQLKLDNNQLSGDLPMSIVNIPATSALDLRINYLSYTDDGANSITNWLNSNHYGSDGNNGSETFLNGQTPYNIQIDTLLKLYVATGGADWTNTSNWGVGNPCTNNWYGISCNANHDVTDIVLVENNMVGNLDVSIVNIPATATIELDDNYLGNNNDTDGLIATWLDDTVGEADIFLDSQKIVAPTNITFSDITPTAVTVHWVDNSNNEDGFKIYKNNGYPVSTPPNVTSYRAEWLDPNMTYTFEVKATKN